MQVSEFKAILMKLTAHDIDNMRDTLYLEFDSYPTRYYGSKAEEVDSYVKWVRGNPSRVSAVVDLANKKLGEKAIQPKTGPVPNTKYISWKDFTSLQSYNEIAEAVEFGYDSKSGSNKNNPITKDGYVSVYAIFNMSRWASWKSSSLSGYERAKSEGIENLSLVDLMKLNEGRNMNQPALFPIGMLN